MKPIWYLHGNILWFCLFSVPETTSILFEMRPKRRKNFMTDKLTLKILDVEKHFENINVLRNLSMEQPEKRSYAS
jgi:hypothetical protein